jgi:hypothetical protein
MGEPSLVFTNGLVFFGCLQKYTRLCHRKRKNIKTSKICLFLLSVISYYYIVFVSINICGIDSKKKTVSEFCAGG